MARKDLRSRLKRLFSTNVIVRNIGGKKLKIADTSHIQSSQRAHLVNRFQGIYSGKAGSSSLGGYSKESWQQGQRNALFMDYEGMDSDPILSSALDIYADESTMRSEYGKVLTIKTDDDNVFDILHNLFYDILNLEFNLWPLTRSLTKYGDYYWYLDIVEEYGVVNVIPISVYDIQRIEGEDPNNPYYVQFKITKEAASLVPGLAGKEEYESFEIAHFRLLADSNMMPYGKSMLEGARKVWKQITLMEDAMLINRIMRAPERRVFKIDVGNVSPDEVPTYMQRTIDKIRKVPYIDQNTGDYNLKFNMENIMEDFFLPVRGSDSGTSIDTLSGLQGIDIEDIEYIRNKMMAALKIPKAFLGYEEGLSSKATLAAEDVRFARTIERIQRIMVSELTKIAIIHLYTQGYTDEELVDFELELTLPSTIYEQEKLELWNQKSDLSSGLIENKTVDSDWVYKHIWKFTEDEVKEIRLGILRDQKRKFRWSQIEMEGNDPVQSGEAVGTAGSMQDAEIEAGIDTGEQQQSQMGETNPVGRPDEPPHYKKDGSARGRDPLGAHDMKKGGSTAKKYGKALSLDHIILAEDVEEELVEISNEHFLSKTNISTLTKQLEKRFGKVDSKILTEVEDLKDEYQSEIKLINEERQHNE